MRYLIIGVLLLAGAPAAMAQHSHGTHEHGVAELRVAVDGRSVRIEFTSPLDNLVGFEHAPRTAKQRQALAGAEETLRQFERLFQLPAAAACTVTAVELQSPWPHQDRKNGSGHHAEMQVNYDLECANPQALTELQVRLTEAFPRTGRIRTETVTPRGQSAITLGKAKRSVPL